MSTDIMERIMDAYYAASNPSVCWVGLHAYEEIKQQLKADNQLGASLDLSKWHEIKTILGCKVIKSWTQHRDAIRFN